MSAQIIAFPRHLTALAGASDEAVLRRVRLMCSQRGMRSESARRVELIASGDLTLGRTARDVIARAEKLIDDCTGNGPRGAA